MREFIVSFYNSKGHKVAERWAGIGRPCDARNFARRWLNNIGRHQGAVRFAVEEV